MGSNLRLLNLSLVLGLVTIGMLVAGSLNSLNNSISLPAQLRRGPITMPNSSYATLIIQVIVETPWRLLGRTPSHFTSVLGDEVSISRSDLPNSAQVTEATNSRGFVQFVLPALKNYLVSLSDPRFHAAFPLNLGEGVTNIIIQGNRQAYVASFVEFPDSESSGWTMAWQTLFLGFVTHGKTMNVSGTVFLETERDPDGLQSGPNISTNLKADEIRATILSELRTSGSTWLLIQPNEDIRLFGISRILVVTYQPTVEIEP